MLNLFVIGMPRSGTKLFRELLNNHPSIFIPNVETGFIPKLIRRFGAGRLAADDSSAAAEIISSSLFFEHYLLERDFDFSVLDGHGSLDELLGAFYTELLREPTDNLIYIGDKSPSNITDVDLLVEAFPSAKFIHIVRDPRDYAISVKKAWNKTVIRAVARWVDAVSLASKFSDKNPDLMIEIRYEDLLENPKSVLSMCMDFLGLEYRDSLLRLERVVENYGDAKEKNISSENKGKYLKCMRPALIKEIDDYAVENMRRYGYSCGSARLTNKPISRYKIHFYTFVDMLNILVFNIRKWGLVRGLIVSRKARMSK